MKYIPRMIRNGDPLALRILKDHVAATLALKRKALLFQGLDYVRGGYPRKVFRSNRHFQRGQANRFGLHDLFAAFHPVFNMQGDGVLDVLQASLVCSSLCIATLQFRGKSEISLLVFFNRHRESISNHSYGLLRDFF